jgi:hypothetical protein
VGRVGTAYVKTSHMKYNGYIEWKDGRIEPTDIAGGLKIIKSHRPDGVRWVHTTFEAARMTDDSLPVYVETETRDVNAEYRESVARGMVEKALRSGVALPRYILQGRYLGETDEEFARRREILRPVVR